MTTTMDVVIDRVHPWRDVLLSSAVDCGGSARAIEASQWKSAIDSGKSDWIVLVDGRATVTAADLQGLAQYLEHVEIPIWLQPSAVSSEADRFIGDHCPEAVSLRWNNPALYSLVCIRRSAINTLPVFEDGHSEAIWDWLIRAAGRPRLRSNVTETAIGDWYVQSKSSGSLVARARRRGLPVLAGPPEKSIPRLISRNPASHIEWLIRHIERAKPSHFIPESDKVSIADSVAVKAGLLLWHDAAEASHQLSQSIEGLGANQAGDYWHAILHRREPDYSNAKYWFRQISPLTIMSITDDLMPFAERTLLHVDEDRTWKRRLSGKGQWDVFAFVDLCEACAEYEDSPLGQATRQIQAAEMHLLMAMTYRDASGCH